MLMRSQIPIHGVGRLAAIRGHPTPVKAAKRDEDHHGRDGVEAEPPSEGRGAESNREQHEENGHHRKNDVHGVGQRELGSPQVHRGIGQARPMTP